MHKAHMAVYFQLIMMIFVESLEWCLICLCTLDMYTLPHMAVLSHQNSPNHLLTQSSKSNSLHLYLEFCSCAKLLKTVLK